MDSRQVRRNGQPHFSLIKLAGAFKPSYQIRSTHVYFSSENFLAGRGVASFPAFLLGIFGIASTTRLLGTNHATRLERDSRLGRFSCLRFRLRTHRDGAGHGEAVAGLRGQLRAEAGD